MAGQIKTIGGAVAVAAALMVGVPGAKMLGARLSVPAYEWRGTAEEFWPRFLTHRIAPRDYAHIRIACPGAMPRHVYMLDHRLLQRSALEAARARHRACTVSQILR